MTQRGLLTQRMGLVLSVVFTGALGLAWWCLGISIVDAAALAIFLPGTALSVAIAVFLLRQNPFALSVPMGAVPLIAANWTSPVGDNDGFWVVIFPILAGWTIVLVALAVGLQNRLSKNGDRVFAGRAPGQSSARVIVAELVVVVVTVAAASWLLTSVITGPWSELQSQLATYPAPAAFHVFGWKREGSPRCSNSCTPQLSLVMHSSQAAAEDCPTLKASLQHWPGVDTVTAVSPMENDNYWEVCAYVTRQRSNGVTREMQAAVSRPPGQPTEVAITALEDCGLTC